MNLQTHPSPPPPADEAMRELARQMLAVVALRHTQDFTDTFFIESAGWLITWAAEYKRMRLSLDEIVANEARDLAQTWTMRRVGRFRVLNGDKGRSTQAEGQGS